MFRSSRRLPELLGARRASSGLTLESMNDRVKLMEYAVRGPIAARAAELEAELAGPHEHPFDKLVQCNTGNPLAVGQRPLTFHRQVLSLVINPALLEDKNTRKLFPEDVVARAERYLDAMPNVGAYTGSQGLETVREEVVNFVAQRDGYPAGATNKIFLTNGASEGVKMIFQIMLRAPRDGEYDGVLVPMPQYPIYSALTALYDAKLVSYHLDEEKGWELSAAAVEAQLRSARDQGINVRGLVVINPGNPVGNCMAEEEMRAIITLCAEEDLVLMADQVYQTNLWSGNQFKSFRALAIEMGFSEEYDPSGKGLELASFHSCSKGFFGECGLRGGYFELFGFDPDVRKQFAKLASISLCPNTIGQITTGLMARPPVAGEASYDTYTSERDAILSSLERRATLVSKAFNEIPHMHCQPIAGALYAFPSIELPDDFVEAAAEKGVAPDAHYCMELMDATGVVCVPGSGFGQRDGTFHFRITILPAEEDMPGVMAAVRSFHEDLWDLNEGMKATGEA